MDFDRLIREHAGAIRRVASAYASDADADDLAQDIALALWRALPGFRGECSLRTFVFRVAHNRGVSHLARRRAVPTELDPASPGPSPEEQVADAHRRDRLVRAVRALPLGQRQAITLAMEGLSQAEVAEVLGTTENNVAVRLHRARAALKERLGHG